MNPLRVCDMCKNPIKDFKDFRELSLIKRVDWDCVITPVWEYELCMGCALGVEQDIMRKIKLKKMRRDA